MKLDRTASAEPERVTLPEGVYKFEIKNTVHKMSKAGVPMWEIQLAFPEHPEAAWVFDYILERDTQMWKFNSLYDAIGMDSDDTDDIKDIVGEEGQVRLTVEHDQQYGDRNKVKTYLKYKEPAGTSSGTPRRKAPQGVPNMVKDDDLPF